MDSGTEGTGGSGLLVDGVEANRGDGVGERGAGGKDQPGPLFGAVLLAGTRADGNYHSFGGRTTIMGNSTFCFATRL